MHVVKAPAPQSAAETVVMAANFQAIIDLVVAANGLPPVLEYVTRRATKERIAVPRVYVELTHPDTWTVNSNAPDHPELELVARDAIELHCAKVAADLEALGRGEYKPLSEVIAELKEACRNPE
jgi:hypothetical protein